jgi:hypothetical protein
VINYNFLDIYGYIIESEVDLTFEKKKKIENIKSSFEYNSKLNIYNNCTI